MHCTVTALYIRSTVLLQVIERWAERSKIHKKEFLHPQFSKSSTKLSKSKKKCQTQGPTEDGTDNRPIIPCF